MNNSFLRPELAVGFMKQDGYYRLFECGGTYKTVWCCDAFTVDHRIVKLDVTGDEPTKQIVEFKVRFKSLIEDHVEFSWHLTSLTYLSRGNELQHVLSSFGLRCSPEPLAAFAIINAIQRTDLVYKDQE